MGRAIAGLFISATKPAHWEALIDWQPISSSILINHLLNLSFIIVPIIEIKEKVAIKYKKKPHAISII